MKQYLTALQEILDRGYDVLEDRTGVGRRKLWGYQTRFDLQEGFPIVTTKRVYEKAVFKELLWLLSGSTNIQPLVQAGVRIWTEWPYQHWLENTGQAEQFPKYSDAWTGKMQEFSERIKSDDAFAQEWGELGPTYGAQWRNFGATYTDGVRNNDGFDQIANAVQLLTNNPNSTRNIVSGWHPVEATKVNLPPCHTLFQFNVAGDQLITHLCMRSADAFLGVPFNIASYAALTHMMAQVTGLKPVELIVTFNDLHLYLNHFDHVREQLKRTPKKLRTLQLNPAVKTIFDFKIEDIQLIDYQYDGSIKAQVAV